MCLSLLESWECRNRRDRTTSCRENVWYTFCDRPTRNSDIARLLSAKSAKQKKKLFFFFNFKGIESIEMTSSWPSSGRNRTDGHWWIASRRNRAWAWNRWWRCRLLDGLFRLAQVVLWPAKVKENEDTGCHQRYPNLDPGTADRLPCPVDRRKTKRRRHNKDEDRNPTDGSMDSDY